MALRQEERVKVVLGFSEARSKTVSQNLCGKLLANTHKDPSWGIVHQCLQTSELQHRRGLVVKARSPRESCGVDKTVLQLFWNCPYAHEVWKKAGPLLK